MKRILPMLDLSERVLCEPFAGTAAVTFAALKDRLVDRVWLNDRDPAIADLWTTVRDQPDALIDCVAGYRPTVEDFYAWRKETITDPLRGAFVLIVLHQSSYSGLGRKAGSPIGGRTQSGDFPIHCRWNPLRISDDIRSAHKLLSRAEVTITCGDWTACPSWEWYVDPPYFAAGASLYRYGGIDHAALADHLRAKREPWLLSYDDDPRVRAMYQWAGEISAGHITYLNHHHPGSAPRKTELLISPVKREPDRLFEI